MHVVSPVRDRDLIDIDENSNTKSHKGNMNEIISNDGGGDSRPNGMGLNRVDHTERTVFTLVSYQASTCEQVTLSIHCSGS